MRPKPSSLEQIRQKIESQLNQQEDQPLPKEESIIKAYESQNSFSSNSTNSSTNSSQFMSRQCNASLECLSLMIVLLTDYRHLIINSWIL